MRVLITGDRNWTNRAAIEKAVDDLLVLHPDERFEFVQGGARGADRIGRDVVAAMRIPVYQLNAHWNHTTKRSVDGGRDGLCPPECKEVTGRGAGPIRNQKMLDLWHPDLVLAFHNDLSQSKGTADMVKRAKKAGIPVRQVRG